MDDFRQKRLPCHIGKPNGDGWIHGKTLLEPEQGAFQELLLKIGARINTGNRRVIAASFALRYGWAAGAPLNIFINHHAVMNLALDNISLRFCNAALYQDYSLHNIDAVYRTNSIQWPDKNGTDAMSEQLYEQAAPVVNALHAWSRFSRRALWSMVVSSWSSQCIRITESSLHDRNSGYALAERILQYNPDLYRNKPVFYSMQHGAEQRLFQKRHGCCLYYLAPDSSFCTSCPLIDDEERVKRSYRYLQQYQGSATSH